jgi:hypothetical protein
MAKKRNLVIPLSLVNLVRQSLCRRASRSAGHGIDSIAESTSDMRRNPYQGQRDPLRAAVATAAHPHVAWQRPIHTIEQPGAGRTSHLGAAMALQHPDGVSAAEGGFLSPESQKRTVADDLGRHPDNLRRLLTSKWHMADGPQVCTLVPVAEDAADEKCRAWPPRPHCFGSSRPSAHQPMPSIARCNGRYARGRDQNRAR